MASAYQMANAQLQDRRHLEQRYTFDCVNRLKAHLRHGKRDSVSRRVDSV
ncbi:hypothetical protein DAPPUDRAFT_251872 [Daphnia pulex]|uniref:Uncharacterized protein n=1 Tax=Daphnia pulex TaxID=6669 RepID=E9H1J7_DAPPU|nr:hypothetical protein DAPPUDRAFT_251872 [Daphnia pulex]|eukprot:EFX74367.1 hypothetical protein DAPPUDRAFT_251872 [Daphnia pulex]